MELAPMADGEDTRLLLDLLSRTLTLDLASLLAGAQDIAAETAVPGIASKKILTEADFANVAGKLKTAVLSDELKHGNTADQHTSAASGPLTNGNVSRLLDDDLWLCGQVNAMQAMVAVPLDARALEAATRIMEDGIYKWSKLKHSVAEVNTTASNSYRDSMARQFCHWQSG